MKVVREIPPDELPHPMGEALGAFFAPPGDVAYCDRCDGLRLKVHDCRCWLCAYRGIPDGTCPACLTEKPDGAPPRVLPDAHVQPGVDGPPDGR